MNSFFTIGEVEGKEEEDVDRVFMEILHVIVLLGYQVLQSLMIIFVRVQGYLLNFQITFHYAVAWTDVDDKLVHRYQKLEQKLRSKVETNDRPKNPRTSTLPRLIKCDGACHSWAPENYVIQFGLCDHNICFRCYQNEESVPLTYDDTRKFSGLLGQGMWAHLMESAKIMLPIARVAGSHGCCNKKCVKRARAELMMEKPKAKHREKQNAIGAKNYTTFPEKKHKSGTAKPRKSGKTRKYESDMMMKLKAVDSDISYYGKYDDAGLQEIAEAMILSAIVGAEKHD
ncbi:unnamed protein product [Angiostrongylus costaricensis]|uniref:Zf-C3HC4 domain-containing protein n=1 Tax=Angiostrongylus costaricensis TaxID=334426 RepID=A0A158PF27_ANGCS|nr:unnamed protein product [Angiostrongylus costaricensis]